MVVEKLGLYMRLSLLKDKTMFGPAPLQCFLATKDYKVVKPENWVSKLNSSTELGLYVGSSTPKDNVKTDKAPLQSWYLKN